MASTKIDPMFIFAKILKHYTIWAIANVFLAFIGKIILKIPWKNLTKESIIVTIEDVYVLAGPVSG